MAEFVSCEQFGEFVKRMEQGFAHASEARTQSFAHVNQRFDDMSRSMSEMRVEMRSDMRQMRTWIIGLYGLVVFGFIGSIVLTMLKTPLGQ